jgi:predicted KAP-like P-loop ATPase
LSGTGTLGDAFFRDLEVALGVGHKPKAGIVQRLSSYAKHLNFLGHVAKPVGAAVALADPVTGGLVAAGGLAAEQSAQVVQAGAEASKAGQEAEARSLAELKRDLGTALTSLRRPILVVVDDIDRLTTEEILQVFQLVKVNADFPNLIYLLLFERSIVEKALDRISGDRGHEFLQKIVQVEFHVPQAHRRAIEKALFSGLDRFIEEETIRPLFDQDRWQDLYAHGIGKYFQNLRHVYRFLGSFGFHVAQFKSGSSFEVNPVDLIGLEALRVFEPELYEQLPSAKGILTREVGPRSFIQDKPDEVEAATGQLLTRVRPERQAQAKAILGVLFPSISRGFGIGDGMSQQQLWLREHRVCHPDLFDKFFALVVGEGDLSQAEMDRLVTLTADRNGFVGECRALLGRGLLDVAFERLDAFKEQTPLTNMPALISALCDLGEELPAPKPGPFEPGLGMYAWRLIYFGLMREPDPKRRLVVLKEAFAKTSGIVLPVDIVSLDQRTKERQQAEHKHLVEEHDLAELKAVCVAKIRAAAASTEFCGHPNFMHLLSCWFGWGDKAEVRGWVAQHVQKATEAVWLLRMLLAKTSSTGAGGTRLLYHVHLPFIEQFVDLNHLTDLTVDLKPEECEGLDRTALIEFRKALKRRSEGRPDNDWQWRITEAE